MNWISKFRCRSAIKKYARNLGPQLKRRYGTSDTYTAGQIKKTAEHARLPVAYICFGYAMYMGRKDFDILHRELGQPCDYEAMRHDVADVCFSGNSSFSVDEAIAYGAAAGGVFGVGGGIDADVGGDGASSD